MKKMLLMVLLLFGLILWTEAAGPAGRISVELYDASASRYEVQELDVIRLLLNGSALVADVPALVFGGRTLVPVRLVAEELRAGVSWNGESREVTINRNECTITLTIGSSAAVVNGEAVCIPDGVPATIARYRGVERTMVPLRFVLEHLNASVDWSQETFTAKVRTNWSGGNAAQVPVSLQTAPLRAERYTIVLDPGHGGGKDGARYEGIAEKDINLRVSLKLLDILRRCGYSVLLTRDADVDIGLYERAAFANHMEADLFVSIHANAYPKDAGVAGAMTFSYPVSAAGANLARAIQASLVKTTGAQDRGTPTDNFVVLRETSMCAVLVEMGFMTNHGELKCLIENTYQDKLAAGIAEGIVRYLNALR